MPFTRAPNCATAPLGSPDRSKASGSRSNDEPGRPMRRREKGSGAGGSADPEGVAEITSRRHGRDEGLLERHDVALMLTCDADGRIAEVEKMDAQAVHGHAIGAAEAGPAGHHEERDVAVTGDVVEMGRRAVEKLTVAPPDEL